MILLEILVALGLTALLLTFLFSFFVESAKIEKKLDAVRNAMTNRGYLQTRLEAIFTSIDRGRGDSFFYTQRIGQEKRASLIAVFDHGVDPDPLFSGSLIGRIYLDKERNLSLALRPLATDPNPIWRNEILFSGIDDFEFEFLGPRTAEDHGIIGRSRPINETLAWKTDWSKKTGKIPSLIRLKVYERSSPEPVRYAFILPVADPLITYLENKGAR